MGKKGYNWKARQVVDTVIEDNSKVKVEFRSKKQESYDQCNTLVIPSTKRKTHKKKNNGPAVTKILSKTQRKKLEKIVERKKKKENRSSILEALAKVQAPEELFNQLTSITSLQTKGLKRHVSEENKGVNSIAGSKKRRLRLMLEEQDANDIKTKLPKDPNVVGVESSSESESDENENEEENENNKPSEESSGVNGAVDPIDDLKESPVVSNNIVSPKPNKNSNYFEVSECSMNSLGNQNRQQCKEYSGSNGVEDSVEELKEGSITSNNVIPSKERCSNHFEVSESIRSFENENTKISLENKNSKTNKEWSCTNKVENSAESAKESLTNSSSKMPSKPNRRINCFEVSDSVESGDKPVLNIDSKTETKNNLSPKNQTNSFTIAPSKQVVPKKESAPTIFVPVNRDKHIQESRLKLPILGEEQTIMEAIQENQIVLLAGETGSGKTTQVPQFLYEAGYTSGGKMIGITEPRRVAAISMSKRVAEELNMSSDKVSYLIRFEGNVTADTQIKFMTDGVLLKELQTDFLLTKYSVIILDEAHERSMYTDILIGLLSRIVPLRNKRGNPLKLIIMSATLRLTDFTENTRLFKTPPPVIKVDSRQFPVTVHFNKQTAKDYVREAYRKACKIHTQLPDGGILIFLTGQQEVNLVMKRLRATFPFRYQKKKNDQMQNEKKNELDGVEEKEEDDDELEEDLSAAINRVKQSRRKQASTTTLPTINLDDYELTPEDDTQGDMLDLDSEEGEDWEEEEEEGAHTTAQPLWVLPLYSLLPSHKQAKVFEPPPEGCRLCVVATNVAETSLTIANVKYVIDAGKAKTRLYDKHTGVSAFDVVWTSKASANQRAGRAGRTSAGHCYRLYSSAVFNNEFVEWSVPEMQRRPVDELLLQMKALGIDRVVNFPFPSPPDNVQLCAAERRLTLLGALHPPRKGGDEFSSKLTALGQTMSVFPVAPRFAKMLCLSHQSSLLAYTVAIVAALSVQEFLLSGDKQWGKTRRQWAGFGHSLLLGDVMVLLRAVGAAEYANSTGNLEKFCADNGLRHKAVVESRKLRKQLTSELNLQLPGLDLVVDPKMSPPSDIQAKQLRQILLSGLVDQVARKLSEQELVALEIRKGKPVYRTPDMEEVVHLSATSALYKTAPEWIVYQEIFQTDKMYFRGVSAIEPEWLPVFAPSLCNLSTPLTEPAPRFNPDTGAPCCHFSGSFGRGGWTLPVFEMDFPEGLERYKWFAVFLLDGVVCDKLKKYTKSLLSTPHTMIKSWAALQPRTDTLLKALVSKEVDCKSSLLSQWKEDSKYLLSAYLTWIPESAHNEVTIMWPPV